MGSINTNTKYLCDTIQEPITPCDENINEQQKEYIEMIKTNTLNELGNIITPDDIKTKAKIDPAYKHLVSIIQSGFSINKNTLIQSYITFGMLVANYQHLTWSNIPKQKCGYP